MRVISQDGKYDLPYKQYTFNISGYGILAFNTLNENDECLLLAEYSSKEKAYKAMEMMRDTYIGKPYVIAKTNTLSDEEIKEIAKGNVSIIPEFDYSRIISGKNIAIFQFPKDKEVQLNET